VTEADLIEDIFRKEGVRYGDTTTTPPIDQPTGPGGITLPTMTAYLGRPATVADLKALTKETATPVVRFALRMVAIDQGFTTIQYEPLRLQLIDFAYNSGPALAIRWLQRVLRVARSGKFDAGTNWAVQRQDAFLVHQALIAARLQMIDMSTDTGTIDKKFEEGLENRALTFSQLEVP
jgi:lysozyme family protein